MVVYVELVLFENFAIDYIILLLAGKFTKIEPKRPWLGAGIGAIYSAIAPLFEFLLHPAAVILALAVMIFASFRKVKAVQYLQLALASLFASAALFGTVYICSKDFLKYNMFYTDDMIFYIALGSVMLGTVTLRILKPFLRETDFNEKTVVLSYKGKEFTALVDTGNTLYYNNIPVILVQKDLLLSEQNMPLIIPYTSVGGGGALLGFKAENIILFRGNKQTAFSCVVALCDHGFGKNCSALMHPDLLGDVV